MKKIIGLFIMVACLFFETIHAQDIHFSQFYENAILRNPALTGIFSGDYKAGVNYRNQWSNISVPFQTGLASVESRVAVNDVGDYVSFGVTATYDHAGSINFNSFQVYPALNYNKALEDEHQSYISAGFTAGYVQRSVDVNKMKFASQYQNGQYDPNNATRENINNPRMSYLDVGAGISLNSSLGENNRMNYYLGAAAYHINKPKAAFNPSESFVRLNTKWNGNLGLNYAIDYQLGFTFHANYSKQGSYSETIMGGLISWRKYNALEQQLFAIYGGVFYRFKDAVIPTIKLDYQQYAITVSYDINSSQLKTASNGMGGFEISIFTRGVLTKGPWAVDKNQCPRFEQMMNPSID